MDLAFIDLMANSGNSWLHHNTASAKFICVLLTLLGIILANHPLQFVPILVMVCVGYWLAQIPLKQVVHYALYPAFFSLIFAVFKLVVSFTAGMVVICKAVSAALVLLLFIFTTPYPELFAMLSKFLPSVLVDGMFFTYRIFFILIGMVKNFLLSVRLRGGYHSIRLFSTIKNLAGAIGVIFIHAFDLSERMHQVLVIRGYQGRLQTTMQHGRQFQFSDYLLIGLSCVVLIVVVIL